MFTFDDFDSTNKKTDGIWEFEVKGASFGQLT
jgi:hypothetical protein